LIKNYKNSKGLEFAGGASLRVEQPGIVGGQTFAQVPTGGATRLVKFHRGTCCKTFFGTPDSRSQPSHRLWKTLQPQTERGRSSRQGVWVNSIIVGWGHKDVRVGGGMKGGDNNIWW